MNFRQAAWRLYLSQTNSSGNQLFFAKSGVKPISEMAQHRGPCGNADAAAIKVGQQPTVGALKTRKIVPCMTPISRHPRHGQTLMLSKRRQFDMRLRHCGPPQVA